MRIECSLCGEIVEITATTVVAPFVCDVCRESRERYYQTPTTKQCGNPGCDDCVDKMCDANDMVDGDSLPIVCDTATVENTTLLIEDLQQQLQDERASIVALEGQVTNPIIRSILERERREVYQEFAVFSMEYHGPGRASETPYGLGLREKIGALNEALEWMI